MHPFVGSVLWRKKTWSCPKVRSSVGRSAEEEVAFAAVSFPFSVREEPPDPCSAKAPWEKSSRFLVKLERTSIFADPFNNLNNLLSSQVVIHSPSIQLPGSGRLSYISHLLLLSVSSARDWSIRFPAATQKKKSQVMF